MSLTKTNSVAAGLYLTCGGLFMFSLLLTLFIFPDESKFNILGYQITQTSSETPSTPLFTFLASWFVMAFTHAGIWTTSESLKIDTAKIQSGYTKKTVWWGAAMLYKIKSSLNNFFALLLCLVLLSATLSALVSGLYLNPVQLTAHFFAIIMGVVSYPLIFLVLKSLWKLFDGKMAAFSPTYTITPTGVDINLNIKYLGKPERTSIVHLEFSELNEITPLRFREAEAFGQEIGPNVQLAFQATQEIIRYNKGEITRPATYMPGIASSGTNVRLRGPHILYFLNFNAPNVDDLITAFQNSKK